MKFLKNEKGVALVTSLMLTLISLGIIMAVLYYVTQGTKLSAAQKRYHNSLEASYGGVEFFSKDLLPQLITAAVDKTLDSTKIASIVGQYPTGTSGINLQVQTSPACLSQKLSSVFGSWSSCSAASKTSSAKSAADLKFTLPGQSGQPGFDVYTKIADTQIGNTSTSGVDLITGGVTASTDGGVISPGQHFPYMYSVEIEGERASNAAERADLTVLYAY